MNGIASFETERGVVWKIRYRNPIAPGQRVTKQITETLLHCESRKQAEGVLAMRRADIFQGTYRPRHTAKPINVAQFVEKFLDVRKDELRAIAAYRSALNNHVVRLLGTRFMFDLKTGDCEDYRRTRLAENAAPATVRNELRYLQSVFVEARKRGVASHDPVADVSFKGIDNARQRLPSPEEVVSMAKRAIAEPDESYLRPLYFVLLCTGMRIGTALSLRWEDVDFENGWVGGIQKGGSHVRPPMSAFLRAELERWKPWSVALGKDTKGVWVFPSLRESKAGYLSQTAVQRAWPRLMVDLEVKDIIRHDLRRHMVTVLRVLLGDDNKAIGAVSGQKTASMIERYDRGAHERAAAVIDRVTDLKGISDGTKSTIDADNRDDKAE